MIGIINKTDKVKYNDLFELARAFMPREQFIEAKSVEEYASYLCLELENGNFQASSGGLAHDSVSFTATTKEIDILRDHEAACRIAAKRAYYRLLSNLTHKLLPWGILTGIRPVKVSAALRENGATSDEIVEILTKGYLIDNDKAELALKICSIQAPLVDSFKGKTYSIYIGIPFCPTRCVYCSFPSVSSINFRNQMDPYIETLIKEISSIHKIMHGWRLDSVYIGGGTPTALPKYLMEKLLSQLRKIFDSSYELTVEAGRPDTIDQEYLMLLKKYGVDRISINPQTMNLNTLKLIGRDHTPDQIIESYSLAKEIGISVVNMDLIAGLPGEGLEKIKGLKPDNLTVHTLSMKKGSRLMDGYDTSMEFGTEKIGEMLKLTSEFAAEIGLTPYYLYRQKQILGNYENIGYSRPQNICVYNVAIMEEKQSIIAAGMGSVSKIYNENTGAIERVPNPKDINGYMLRIDELVERRKTLIAQLVGLAD
jgi:oxygen-independent coproporphyrinogen-3 oxidase